MNLVSGTARSYTAREDLSYIYVYTGVVLIEPKGWYFENARISDK